MKRKELESLAFLSDNLIIGGDGKGYLNVISLEDHACPLELPGHTDRIYKIAVYDNLLYTVGDQTLK